MKIVYNIPHVGQMVSCYTNGNCLYIGIRLGRRVPKGQQSHLQKRKVVLRERVPEEIIKENIKRKTKIIFFLLKRNIFSITATEVILVIKRNNNKQIWERCSS